MVLPALQGRHAGVNCPLCQHPRSRVVRTSGTGAGIVRVRQCEACGHPWKTEEISAEAAAKVRDILGRLQDLAGVTLE